MKHFHILLALIVFNSLYFNSKLWTQCPDAVAAWAVQGGIKEICEGKAIVVDNKVDEFNPVACVDFMIWDWGDGQKDTVTHFNDMTHVYNFPPFNGNCSHANGEDFDIDLRVYYYNGDTHHQLAPVTVRPKPQAAFMIPLLICISDPTVVIDNKSCYADTYKWTINPGNIVLTVEDPQYTFPGVGTYTVQLEATSPTDWGCGTDIAVQQVQVVGAPQAVATANISDYCAPSILQLSSAGSSNFTSFSWTIMTSGGGMYQWLDTVMNPQNLPNPKVLFKTPGAYTITLTVHGAADCDDAVVALPPIIINDSPIAFLSSPPPFCYQGSPVAYSPIGSVTSNGGYTNLTYNWFFENGTPATSNTLDPGSVTWNQPGDWEIKFIVIGDPSPSNPCGTDTVKTMIHIAAPSTIGVTHTNPPPGDCGPYSIAFANTSTGTTLWEWSINKNGGTAVLGVDYQFENGTTKDSQNVVIQFLTPGEYTVQLGLENVACGLTQSQPFPFSVKMAPTVDATPVGLQCVPAQVTFPAAVFSDGNDPSNKLNWTFPGGTPNTAMGPGPHTVDFVQPGMPFVTVTAQNGCGMATDTFSFILDLKTQVAFDLAPDSICKNAAPIQLSTNLMAAACFPPNVPNGVLDPATLNNGWNSIVVTNCSSAPGCGTSDTLNIYVLNETLSFGTVPSFCDTIGTEAITGFSPPDFVEFSGGPYITVGGVIDAAVAGYGEHPILMTYKSPGLGCVFSLNTTFNVFEVPTSGITGPGTGCTNFPQEFSFSSASDSLDFDWTFESGTPGSSTQQNPTTQWDSAGSYDVRLIVSNTNGCSDTAYAQIDIEEPLQVTIIAEPMPTMVCPDVPVNIIVTIDPNPQNWFLFVSNYDTIPNFTSGTFQFLPGVSDTTYTLTASASHACPVEDASVEVLVHPLPGPNLGASSLNICSGDTVFYYHNSTGGPYTDQSFDPGNGPTSVDLPINGVRYFAVNNQITEYFAILTLTNNCGTRKDTVKITVLPEDIIPAVQMNDTIFCVGDTLWLKSFATSATNPNLFVSYHFSNGLIFTSKDAIITLTEAGIFWFDQWVTDGCSWDKTRRFFVVRPAPEVGFSQVQDTVCVGSTLAKYAYPETWEQNFRSFIWQSSDGGTGSGLTFEKTWPQAGWQSVTLIVTYDTSGCSASLSKDFHIRPNPVPIAAATDTSACGSLTTTLYNANPMPGLGYEWMFSDGTTDVGPSVTHTFAGPPPELFSATLRATDVWGCTAKATLTGLHAIPVPHPEFTTSEPHACGLGHTIFLDNQTTDGLGTDWYLNGNYIGSHTDTSLTFEVAGDYLLKLVSSNQWGCEASTEYLFKVLPSVLALGEGPSQACERNGIAFENFSENSDSVQWYFGNGFGSSTFSPTYEYPDAGNYQVMLIAIQKGFCADTFIFPHIIEILKSPVAGFSATSLNMGLVTIIDSSQNAVFWLYEFPDLGLTSQEASPTVDYSSNGLKMITQTVTNELGCSDSDTLFFEPLFFGGLAVPNAVIPDVGTGPHNCFTPTGEGLESFKLDIFSPWGTNIFHAEGVVNGRPTPAANWCGKDVEGKLLPPGAYLWQIEATFRRPDGSLQKWEGMTIGRGSTIRRTIGSVTLLR